MWNAQQNKISDHDIYAEHLRVLEDAITEAAEFDIRSNKAIHKALDFCKARSCNCHGVSLYLKGIKENRVDYLRDGFRLIKRS